LITPEELFTASAVDARYVVPGWLILVLSIEPRWGRWQKAAIALALATMVMHTANITTNWLVISRRSEQVLAMGRVLPVGARIYAVQAAENVSTKLDRGFIHIIQFWTLSHGAYISSLFATRGQQPLVSRRPPCNRPTAAECLASYDYVWTYNPPTSIHQALFGIATPAAIWENVTLWRVNRKTVSSASRRCDAGFDFPGG
jgi:hypothetical protein